MASMASPNRRVLGSKSTNASLSFQGCSQPVKGEKQVISNKMQPLVASPLRIGTKRRFEELVSGSYESSYEHDTRQHDARPRVGSESSPKLEIEETDEDSGSLTSSFVEASSATASSGTLYTSANTVLTSFHASQEPSQPIEEQFEIVQEESQRTLEQIHATPMPETRLSLLLPQRPSLETECSQDSVRMSSFIEFEDVEDSQQEKADEDLEMITPPQPSVKEESPKSKQILERATTLRTRLQLAMHKVETNQTSKPFSRLDKPKSASPELSLPRRMFSAPVLRSAPLQSEHCARFSPESQIAIRRARAFRGAYQGKPVQRLNSLPVPKIVPTAYSSRYTVDPQVQQGRSQQQLTQITSSPPPSHRAENLMGSWRMAKTRATPSSTKTASTRVLQPKTPRHQLSSPPGSDDGDDVWTGRKLHSMGRSALTSSVVKGEAANGLLELMRAGSR